MSVPAASRWSIIAHNVRRLMARDGLTYEDVCEASGLDARTLRGVLRAAKRPHAKTLQRLAEGLGVTPDELFAGDASIARAEFDAATNPAIEEAVESAPELFDGWTPSDFGELASRVGAGGALTPHGVRLAAELMNANRQALTRAQVVLETGQADALRTVIDALYDRATAREQ
ncbi:helix-turn-helix protein [Botrimarina colliarenosi]|uniref:Helix-turn-helix protein n=1 Tax=Botrimarina colliarenosi TaxID=2528001 RepID=A0A5C6AC00_9BACT|nr:helix-turn-helix transcriptional regulator [Botrimarina colliarenosi]TWT96848.1 helix-turn-helix protein [Botrimarina colliarenosi]